MMARRKTGYVVWVLAASFLAWGCSTTRDGRLYRVYHNMNSHYNGFFYASEAMDEADVTLKEDFEENWDEILPIFYPVNEELAQQVYPLMERAIEKCAKVVDKHTMAPPRREQKDLRWPEMNKWIDENYDIIGRAHLIKGDVQKAEEVFLYLVRTLDYPEGQAWSNAWLGRTYMAMNDQVRARNALIKAAQMDGVDSDEVRAYVHMVYAAFYLQYEQPEAAITQLQLAIEHTKRNKDRARPMFILAQCLEATNQSKEAIAQYQEVVKLRTPYELEFYSKIKQAMAFDRRGGNSEPIVLLLEEMLEDAKNDIYQDQVYYALAELALEERRRDEGIALLKKSLYVNTENIRQRAKSYLRLGDLYMEDLVYVPAQAYYDSAYVLMPVEDERYDEVKGLAENLTDLVENLRIIETQDSLLALCELSEPELAERIADIILAFEEAAERERLAQEAAEAAELAAQGAGTGMVWPYNAQLRVGGRRNFVDFWGDRELADHWRRSLKTGASFSDDPIDDGLTDTSAPGSGGDEATDGSDSSGIPTFEELTANLPCSPEGSAAAHSMIAEAYYNAGLDYKEKLDDLPNALESWETLIGRYDDSGFHATSHYQLYRTYLLREAEENYQNPFCATCNSEYWAAQILQLYPGSEWAILVENPEYADEEHMRREHEREVYEAHLGRYYAKDYQNTLMAIVAVLSDEPLNNFTCQYRVLRAQCIGGLSSYTQDREAYYLALRDVIGECPDGEEAEFARNILEALVDGEGADDKNAEALDPLADLPFEHKPYLDHYFAVIVPVGRGNVEQIKATISDFDQEFFRAKNLRVTANLIDKTHQIILVKSFRRQDRGMEYYEIFTQNREALMEINTSGYHSFLISSENYVELFKSKNIEGYRMYFEEVYLDGTE
jgi:tetratricopeptide (TPR) repeat protein